MVVKTELSTKPLVWSTAVVTGVAFMNVTGILPKKWALPIKCGSAKETWVLVSNSPLERTRYLNSKTCLHSSRWNWTTPWEWACAYLSLLKMVSSEVVALVAWVAWHWQVNGNAQRIKVLVLLEFPEVEMESCAGVLECTAMMEKNVMEKSPWTLTSTWECPKSIVSVIKPKWPCGCLCLWWRLVSLLETGRTSLDGVPAWKSVCDHEQKILDLFHKLFYVKN